MTGVPIACNGAGGRVGFEINAFRAGPLMRVVIRQPFLVLHQCQMSLACPNCQHVIQDEEADSSFRDGFEPHRNVWLRDSAIRCRGCRVVIAKTDSNVPDQCKDWDFHRITDLGELTEVKPEEFDDILARIQRYKSMHAELDMMLSSRREGEVVYRFNTSQGRTGIAICCNSGVIQTFSTFVSV